MRYVAGPQANVEGNTKTSEEGGEVELLWEPTLLFVEELSEEVVVGETVALQAAIAAAIVKFNAAGDGRRVAELAKFQRYLKVTSTLKVGAAFDANATEVAAIESTVSEADGAELSVNVTAAVGEPLPSATSTHKRSLERSRNAFLTSLI